MPRVVKNIPSKLPALNSGVAPVIERLQTQMQGLQVGHIPIGSIKPNPRNAKDHPEAQVSRVGASIHEFGFTNPIKIDENNVIISGHGRYLAARELGLMTVPCIQLSYLTAIQKKGLALAENKLAELGVWNVDILQADLSELFRVELDFDPRITGFDTVEVDQILQPAPPPKPQADAADDLKALEFGGNPVSSPGTLWLCGPHAVLCENALDVEAIERLLDGERAGMAFTDPPFNVSNAGHVTKRDGVREFPMAAGEMSRREFTEFLSASLALIARYSIGGAVVYVCMDWRHTRELLDAGEPTFGPEKNRIVWTKTSGGQGTFYRSQHEMIHVFINGSDKPVNNFRLGEKGRYRTNVWTYPGCSSFGKHRDESLSMHPTVKPVAMVADAMMDCSNRNDLILDPFGGSGTTMIAAERVGRRARLIELDPLYCDLIVRRWQQFTGVEARLAGTNQTFNEVAEQRGDMT